MLFAFVWRFPNSPKLIHLSKHCLRRSNPIAQMFFDGTQIILNKLFDWVKPFEFLMRIFTSGHVIAFSRDMQKFTRVQSKVMTKKTIFLVARSGDKKFTDFIQSLQLERVGVRALFAFFADTFSIELTWFTFVAF